MCVTATSTTQNHITAEDSNLYVNIKILLENFYKNQTLHLCIGTDEDFEYDVIYKRNFLLVYLNMLNLH